MDIVDELVHFYASSGRELSKLPRRELWILAAQQNQVDDL